MIKNSYKHIFQNWKIIIKSNNLYQIIEKLTPAEFAFFLTGPGVPPLGSAGAGTYRFLSYQARARSAWARRACALRALGLLLADGTPTGGRGEDFLSRQPDFFTETAVTPEREVMVRAKNGSLTKIGVIWQKSDFWAKNQNWSPPPLKKKSSKHLKGQLDSPVGDVTFLDQD